MDQANRVDWCPVFVFLDFALFAAGGGSWTLPLFRSASTPLLSDLMMMNLVVILFKCLELDLDLVDIECMLPFMADGNGNIGDKVLQKELHVSEV